MANEDLDSERLRTLTSKMVDAITSPPYVEAMRAVKSAPEGRRLEEALRRLTPDALREQGVDLPEDMRISSRYFEEGFSPLELGKPGEQRNLLTELHAADPEVINVIDRLRGTNVTLYGDLVRRLAPGEDFEVGPLALCGCAGGGAATVCGCAGGG